MPDDDTTQPPADDSPAPDAGAPEPDGGSDQTAEAAAAMGAEVDVEHGAAEASPAGAPDDGTPAEPAMPDFGAGAFRDSPEGIDLLSDVNLQVKIELGRTRMLVEDVLRLGEGSVVELDKLAGDPVDIYVNDRHVARGEVLVLNDNFCVRVSEIVAEAAQQTERNPGAAA